MISQFYSKEDDLKKENPFSKFNNNLIQNMSLISYFAGENVVVGYLLATICLIATYSKYLGTICFFIHFQGIAQNPFNILIKIFSQTSFFLEHELIYQVIILFFFLFNLIYFLSFIIIEVTVTSKDNKMILYGIIRLYQFMNIINFWLFLSFEIELSFCVLLKFTPNPQPLIYQVLGGINIVMTLTISIIYCLFGNKVEYNFELCDYFSRLDTLYEFLILMEKLLISVIYIVRIGFDFDDNIYLSICLVIVVLMTLALTNYSFYYYNYTNMLLLFFNLATCYAAMVSIICYNINTINGGDFWICAGYFILFPVSKFIITFYWNRLLSQIPFVEIKQEHVLCKYMLMLIYLVCVENLNEVQRLKLIGVVKQHQQNCVFEGCVCKEENGSVLYIPKNDTEYVIQNEDFSYENSKIYFKHLVKKEYEFLIKVTRNNNTNLIMMYSYYMFYYIGNYYTSMYALLNLKKNKNLNYQQKSSLNRIFEMIHHKIESINSGPMKRRTSERSTTYFKVDFSRIILYYEKVTKLKSAITLALEYSTQFWTCIQNRVEIHLIKKNGLEFYKYHSLIEEAYKEINQIYDNLEEVNNYYSRYKESVFNEQTKLLFPSGTNHSSSSVCNTTQNQFKSQEDSIQENEKYYHPKCVIVIANLTDKNKAIIEKISENIKSLLNYSPTECLSQDVKLLMPNIYKATHSYFIQTHFETGRNAIVNHEKTTYALHSNNYSIPIMISIKMLPNYSDNVYYVSVLREIPIDYDFIITTPNGKIEMISKGIFNKLFNSSNIQLFNSIDYYINFICKEYFAEISKIYSEDYQLTNFLIDNEEKKEYKYTLLHFKSDASIDNTLREYKKNENTQNNMYSQTNRQSMLEAPILKIIQMKEKILTNFNRESIKKYVKIEQYQIFLDEYVYCFKLYSNINSDGLVNLDEIKLIDKYIQRKEDDKEDPKKPFRILYSIPEPNEIKKRNINIKEYNEDALNKGKLYMKAQLRGRNGTFLLNSQKTKFDKEQLKAYLSMKKSYSKKKEYTQVKYALLYNIIFLIGMVICVSLNYLKNEKEISKIFGSLNDEYFTFLPLYLNLAIINKNYDIFLIKDDYFQNNVGDLKRFFEVTENAREIITKSIIDMTVLTFYFSNDFLNLLNQQVVLQRPSYFNASVGLKNAIVTFVSQINTVGVIDQVNNDNVNIKMLLMNLNDDFYTKFKIVFNLSLNDTNNKVQLLIRDKKIFIWVLMALIILFGCYLYIMILCFYCEQNRMIAMLLSIDIDECDSILSMIRELKLTSQKNKINEDSNKSSNNNKENNSRNNNNNNNNNEEKEALIDNTNNMNLDYEIRKAVNEEANKKKKGKKKKKGVQNTNNSISKKIIISFLLRIIILILFNVSPFIYSISQTFYIKKCEKIIDLIQNFNNNQFDFLTSFLYFEKITSSEKPTQQMLTRLNEIILEMKTNQFESTNKLFDTLEGFDNQEKFETFYSRNFCSSIRIEYYCNNTSPYNHQSFLYITNINIELIEDMLRNTKAAMEKKKEDINKLLHDSRYYFADETFNLMSVYGFNELTTFIKNMIDTFIGSYNKQIVIVFSMNIILMFMNQIISIWLLKYIIEAVDIELKNIFSLIPFPLALEDANIKELLSK